MCEISTSTRINSISQLACLCFERRLRAPPTTTTTEWGERKMCEQWENREIIRNQQKLNSFFSSLTPPFVDAQMNGRESRTNCFESNKTIFLSAVELDSKNEKIEHFRIWAWSEFDLLNKISAAHSQPKIFLNPLSLSLPTNSNNSNLQSKCPNYPIVYC